jgi:hypothetical protein
MYQAISELFLFHEIKKEKNKRQSRFSALKGENK